MFTERSSAVKLLCRFFTPKILWQFNNNTLKQMFNLSTCANKKKILLKCQYRFLKWIIQYAHLKIFYFYPKNYKLSLKSKIFYQCSENDFFFFSFICLQLLSVLCWSRHFLKYWIGFVHSDKLVRCLSSLKRHLEEEVWDKIILRWFCNFLNKFYLS